MSVNKPKINRRAIYSIDNKRHKETRLFMMKIISLSCCFFIFLSLVPTISIAEETKSLDFSQFVKVFYLKDKDGNILEGDIELSSGQEINPVWEFDLNSDQIAQVKANMDKVYSLKIPDSLYKIIKDSYENIAENSQWVKIESERKDFIFEYKFSKNGEIKIKFVNINSGEIGGTIEPKLAISENVKPGNHIIKVETSQGLVEINVKVNISIGIEKKFESIDKDNGDVKWSMIVTPPNDTNLLAGAVLTDEVQDDFQVIPSDLRVYISQDDQVIDVTEDVVIFENNKGFTYTFPQDIKEGACKVIFSSKLQPKDFEFVNGKYTLKNKADIVKDKLNATSSAQTDIYYDMIDKDNGTDDVQAGYPVKDEDGFYSIDYSIVLNRDGIKMGSDVKLQDILPKGTMYKNDFTYISRFDNNTNKYVDEIKIDEKNIIVKDTNPQNVTINLSEIIKENDRWNLNDQYKIRYRIKFDPKDLQSLGSIVGTNDNGQNFYKILNKATLYWNDFKISDTSDHIITELSNGEVLGDVNIVKSGKVLYGSELDRIYKQYGIQIKEDEGIIEDGKESVNHNYIEWTVLVGALGSTYEKSDKSDYIFTDELPIGTSYVKGTARYDGIAIAEHNINVDSSSVPQKLSFSLGNQIKGGKKITYLVKIDDTKSPYQPNNGFVLNGFGGDASISSNTGYENTAYLTTNKAVSKVEYDVSKRLEKIGNQISSNTFRWTISFNMDNSVFFKNPTIVDFLPEGHELVTDSIKYKEQKLRFNNYTGEYYKEYIAQNVDVPYLSSDYNDSKWRYEYEKDKSRFTLKYVGNYENPSYYTTNGFSFTFDTRLTKEEENRLNEDKKKTYINSCLYQADNLKTDNKDKPLDELGDLNFKPYNKVEASVNAVVNKTLIKDNSGYDVKTGCVNWQIKIHQNLVNGGLEDAVIEDYLPKGLIFKPETLKIERQLMLGDRPSSIIKTESPDNYTVEIDDSNEDYTKISIKFKKYKMMTQGYLYTISYDTAVTGVPVVSPNRVTFTGKGVEDILSAESSMKLESNGSAYGKAYNLNIVKYDKENKDKKLENVEFLITRMEKFGLPEKTFKVTTDKNGNAQLNYALLDGFEYKIGEITSTKGYYIDNPLDIVIIDDKGNEQKFNSTFTFKKEYVNNDFNIPLKLGVSNTIREVKLVKQDENDENKKLEGAKFGLYSINGNKINTFREEIDENGRKYYIYDINKEPVDLITNEIGQIVIKGLDEGKYYFKEEKAPDNYILDSETNHEFELSKYKPENSSVEVIVNNKSIESSLQFTKISGNTNKPLAGAVFRLYLFKGENIDDHNGVNENLEDESIWELEQEVSSKEDGVIDLKISSGIYRLVEVKAPDKYELPGGSWRIDVDLANDQLSITTIGEAPSFEKDDIGYKLKNYRLFILPESGGSGYTRTGFIGFLMVFFSTIYFIKNNIKRIQYK